MRGWTSDGQLGHASFKALRHEVEAEEVVRVTFAGDHAPDPMRARVTADLGIPVNILAGAVEEIGTRPFGNLLVSLPVARAAEARGFLERHNLLTEVLGYVR